MDDRSPLCSWFSTRTAREIQQVARRPCMRFAPFGLCPRVSCCPRNEASILLTGAREMSYNLRGRAILHPAGVSWQSVAVRRGALCYLRRNGRGVFKRYGARPFAVSLTAWRSPRGAARTECRYPAGLFRRSHTSQLQEVLSCPGRSARNRTARATRSSSLTCRGSQAPAPSVKCLSDPSLGRGAEVTADSERRLISCTYRFLSLGV